jgi:hypothetical protein
MKAYNCCDERRCDAVRSQSTLKGVDYNGINYLEVDFDEIKQAHILRVYFIHALKPGVLKKENVRITGGVRIRDIAVNGTDIHSKTLTVTVNKSGDSSVYTLSVLADPKQLLLDQPLSFIDFTFNLPMNTIDCATEEICVPGIQLTPDIDYLAKDFTSFRQLMLDRLSTLIPQWQERSTADIGVMMVEVLAYVADHLSYQQDVIATESYLSTARRRISARRHARLLDYLINEGCNARVWVQVQVKEDLVSNAASAGNPPISLLKNTKLLTQITGQDQVIIAPGTAIYSKAMSTQPTVFEPMGNTNGLFVAHNQISLYTWGERECCLPKGSTRATLCGKLPDLKPGDVLIFKELVDPHTGAEEGAEPSHRHAVRLTKVLSGEDPLGTWPNDQSGAQDDPLNLGKVIAEFQIVEEDRLLIEEARMTSVESGQRIEKLDERVEEDTYTTIHRYLIEKPDKSIVTVEVHMRETDRHVELHFVEAGHVAQPHHKEEIYEEVVNGEEETYTQETTEIEQKADQVWDERTLEEMEEDEEDIMRQPTTKLPKVPIEQMTSEEIAEIDTQQFPTPQSPEDEIRRETDSEEEEEEEIIDIEREPGEETMREEKRQRTRIVHTYHILREPDYHVDITEIEWGYEDALPFPLCISTTTDYEHGHRYVEDVSIALGNIVLTDHGMTFSDDEQKKDYILLPNIVPESIMNWAISQNGQPCEQPSIVKVAPRFYPQLKYSPLSFAVPYDSTDPTLSATALMQFDASTAVPTISLQSDLLTQDGNVISQTCMNWQSQRDLLRSNATYPHFVVEIETDGSAFLRFGDDQHGLQPDPHTRFLAKYRVGNGIAGNIGHDSLYHLVSDNIQLREAVIAVNNPLPALGGIDRESIEDIRQNAPGSFSLPERGVTPQDYKAIVERDFQHQVHRANAILRWTGSWYTVFLAVERVGGMPVDDIFKRQLRKHLEKYRMAGSELVIVAPVYVPLEIAMIFTIKSGYLPGNVKTALLKVFSNQQWPDGERGIFYADKYTFGSTVYLNPLYKAASAVPGVDSVKITTFQRQGIAGTGLVDGSLPMDWLEIPLLENNPHYPERGIFSMTVETQNMEAQYVRS